MFEGACWTTVCSPEASSPSPAPTPAKNMDLGTFEAHAESGPQDWAETLVAPPPATAQARTKNKAALFGMTTTPSLDSLRLASACPLLPPSIVFGSPRPELEVHRRTRRRARSGAHPAPIQSAKTSVTDYS